jgi:hypothetical protein
MLSRQPVALYRNAAAAQAAERGGYVEAPNAADSEEFAQFLPGFNLTSTLEAALAGQLAETLEKLQRLKEAASYWEIAVKLEPAGPSRQQFQRRLNKVQAELKTEERDARRRPQVSEHLEQKGLVRPRLISKPGAASSPLQSGGGGQ